MSFRDLRNMSPRLTSRLTWILNRTEFSSLRQLPSSWPPRHI
uniref:Clusterin associated protein 1 n=2 Tax=Homo sapiens TaxID=9606 RepID=I3L2E1_HUMAN